MINDILDLAKVEAGKMEIKCTEFDLSALSLNDMLHSLSEDKNISFEMANDSSRRPLKIPISWARSSITY